jgi:hypothetical protein
VLPWRCRAHAENFITGRIEGSGDLERRAPISTAVRGRETGA